MANEHIESLKNLINDHKNFEETLGKLLIDKKLKAEDLINAQKLKKPFIVPPNILNGIGLKFRQGKDGYPQDERLGVELYKLGAKQDNAQSFANLANCALYGYGTSVNLKAAETFCKEAIKFGRKESACFLGVILWEQKNWEAAIDQFIKINNSNKENYSKAQHHLGLYYLDKIDNPDTKKALACFKNVDTTSSFYNDAEEKIKELYENEIQKIFELLENEQSNDSLTETSDESSHEVLNETSDKKINETSDEKTSEISDDQNEQESNEPFKPLNKKGWYALSPLLHGHNPKEEENIITEFELASLELDIAESAYTCVIKRKKELFEKELPESTKKAIEEKVQQTRTIHSDAQQTLDLVKNKYNELTNSAMLKRYQRQRKVEETYFAPKRTFSQETKSFAKTIQDNRLVNSIEEIEVLEVDSNSTRRLITAELAVMTVGLNLNGYSTRWYGEHFGWSTGNKEKKDGYEITYCYNENISLGGGQFTYRQRNNPHYNHPGDYYMSDLGKYSEMVEFINKITGSNSDKINILNEKKLAGYMLRYSQSGNSMTLDELKHLYTNATEDDLLMIHRIFYHCFVKEPSRFFLAKENNHQLPLVSANARALQLLVRGHLKMCDVFSQDAPYGVFTAKEIGSNIDALKTKIDIINKKYEKQLLNTYSAHADNYFTFMHHHPQSKVIPTRQQFRKELQEVYGGESDSDGEGYDTDDEFTLKI